MIQVLVDGKLCWRRTEEELKRQSESMKKTWSDPLYQKRISEIQTKRQSDPKLREQMSESCKKAWTPEMRKEVSERSSKYTHTEETRALISQKLMGHVLSYETRTQISETRLKLLKEDPTIQARASQSMKEKWEDPEYREYMYKVLPGWHFDSEGLKNLSEGHKRSYVEDPTLKERCAGMKGKTHTPETIQRMSQIRRLFWESLTPEEKVQHISKLTASWNQRPTLPEVIVNNYLQTYHIDEWSYTGKAEKWVGGRNPDFINESAKQIIEVFGDYFHDPAYFPNTISEEALIKHYHKYGYNCLILWEHVVYVDSLFINAIEATFYERKKTSET